MDGSGTSDDGWRPIPKRLGISSIPGRSSVKLKNRAEGASAAGVMPKRFDAKVAPSGVFPLSAGIFCSMMLFSGSARPSTPEYALSSGSDSRLSTAASACWLMLYPPMSSWSQYIGPVALPCRYWMPKSWPVEVAEDGS